MSENKNMNNTPEKKTGVIGWVAAHKVVSIVSAAAVLTVSVAGAFLGVRFANSGNEIPLQDALGATATTTTTNSAVLTTETTTAADTTTTTAAPTTTRIETVTKENGEVVTQIITEPTRTTTKAQTNKTTAATTTVRSTAKTTKATTKATVAPTTKATTKAPTTPAPTAPPTQAVVSITPAQAESYANSYMASLGINIDYSYTPSNSGYYAPLVFDRYTSYDDWAKSQIRAEVDWVLNRCNALIPGDYLRAYATSTPEGGVYLYILR